MEDYIPDLEIFDKKIISHEIESDPQIQSKSYNISLLNEEFELSIILYKEYIQFKLQQKDIINNHYYKKEYNLETINKLLFASFKELKESFNFLDKIMNEKKVELIQGTEKNIIILNYKENKNETKFELRQIKSTKDELFFNLLNEFNILKKKLNSKTNEESEKNEEIKKVGKEELEEKIDEINDEIKKFEEKITILKKQKEEYIKELHNKEQKITDEPVVKLRGKHKEIKTKNVPDIIDIDRDDQLVAQMINENNAKAIEFKDPKGKCQCNIY